MSFGIAIFPTLLLCPGRITARTAAIFTEHGVQMVNKEWSNQGVHKGMVCGVIDAQIWSHSRFSTDFSVFVPPKLDTGRAAHGTARLRDSSGPKLRV